MDFPWPNDTTRAFSEVNDYKSPSNWIGLIDRSIFLPDSYKESADILIDQISSKNFDKKTQYFISPIAYLYRHCFELYMKRIITLGIKLCVIEQNENIEKILFGHKLHPLWNKVRLIIESIFPSEDKKVILHVENFIQQFHTVDKSGQVFRFALDKSGNPTEKYSIIVDFSSMKKSCGEIFFFFKSSETGLEYEKEQRDRLREQRFRTR